MPSLTLCTRATYSSKQCFTNRRSAAFPLLPHIVFNNVIETKDILIVLQCHILRLDMIDQTSYLVHLSNIILPGGAFPYLSTLSPCASHHAPYILLFFMTVSVMST